jgi:hypothetical protein
MQYNLSSNVRVSRVISPVCCVHMLASVGQTLNSVLKVSSSVYNLVQHKQLTSACFPVLAIVHMLYA